MHISDDMRSTALELVRTQKTFRNKVRSDIGEAAVESPEKTAFDNALERFNAAVATANPEFSLPPADFQARSLHHFLQEVAVAEGVPSYESPRPYRDMLSAVRQ